MNATNRNAPAGTGARDLPTKQETGSGQEGRGRRVSVSRSRTSTRANQSTNTEDYTMQNAEIKPGNDGATKESFRAYYGPCANLWLVDGVLPMAGVVLLEAETMLTAALVADDMGAMVATGQDWGDRAAIIGRTILFDMDGVGRFIEHDADGAVLPRLDMTCEPHPEAVKAIKAAGGVDLLIIHVPEQTADDALCVPRVALSAMELARDLECCVLLVTGPATIRPRDELYAAADVALYASAPRGDRPGEIVQTVGPGDDRGRWNYTLEPCIEFGDPETEIVGEVWGVAPRVN